MSIYKIIITPKVEAIASDYIQKMKPDSNSDNYVQNRIKDIIDDIHNKRCLFSKTVINSKTTIRPRKKSEYISYLTNIYNNYDNILKTRIYCYNDDFNFERNYSNIDNRVNVTYYKFTKNGRSSRKTTTTFHEMIVHIMDYDRVQSELFPEIIRRLNIKTCVYCNINYALSTNDNSAFYQLDHCLPKSKYPYLCTSFYNLQPSCASCNQRKSSSDLRFGNNKEYNLSMWKKDETPNYYHFCIPPDELAKYLQEFGSRDNKKIRITLQATEGSNNEVKDLIEALNEKLKIIERYNNLTDIAEEIIWKYKIHSLGYYNSIMQRFSEFFPNYNEQIDRFIWGNYMNEKDIFKRPLSKLIQDIKFQLEKTKIEAT